MAKEAAAEIKIKKAKIKVIKIEAEIKLKDTKNKLEISNINLRQKERELLQSRQAVTARGIMEYFLKEANNELFLKGYFNASNVCNALKVAGF